MNRRDGSSAGRAGTWMLCAAVALVCLALAAQASGATFEVTKTEDDDGPCNVDDCSLREAVIAANGHPGEDTIVLPGGTYNLTIGGPDEDFAKTGDLDLTDNVTIKAQGESMATVDAEGLAEPDRVFHIRPTVAATISGIEITGGSAILGGGIYNEAGLSLQNCTLSENQAVRTGGGVYNAPNGSVKLEDCVFSNNSAGIGGGIGSYGDLDLKGCTFSKNEAFAGGGIFSSYILVLENCTFSKNEAFAGGGGGIFSSYILVLENCTFSKNQAIVGGGVDNSAKVFQGSATLRNCTFSGNSAQAQGGGYSILGS